MTTKYPALSCSVLDTSRGSTRCSENNWHIMWKNVESHDMKLLKGAKAYLLLQAANLIIDEETMAQ